MGLGVGFRVLGGASCTAQTGRLSWRRFSLVLTLSCPNPCDFLAAGRLRYGSLETWNLQILPCHPYGVVTCDNSNPMWFMQVLRPTFAVIPTPKP